MKIKVINSSLVFQKYETPPTPFSATFSALKINTISLGVPHFSSTKTTRFYIKSDRLVEGNDFYMQFKYGTSVKYSLSITPQQAYAGHTFDVLFPSASTTQGVSLTVTLTDVYSSTEGIVVSGNWKEL